MPDLLVMNGKRPDLNCVKKTWAEDIRHKMSWDETYTGQRRRFKILERERVVGDDSVDQAFWLRNIYRVMFSNISLKDTRIAGCGIRDRAPDIKGIHGKTGRSQPIHVLSHSSVKRQDLSHWFQIHYCYNSHFLFNVDSSVAETADTVKWGRILDWLESVRTGANSQLFLDIFGGWVKLVELSWAGLG